MKTKTKLILTTAAAIALLTARSLYNGKVSDPTQEDQTPKTNQATNQDYAFMAAVYQSKDGEFIARFRNEKGEFEFYKATEERATKSGEGVLAELDRAVWTKYGTALCSKVLQSMGEHPILRAGDPLYDLEPIPTISKDELKQDYNLRVAYGTGHNLFGEATNITDIVNQK